VIARSPIEREEEPPKDGSVADCGKRRSSLQSED
jgi:hypothetical protein